MPNADHDELGPRFEGRLKDALDRIAPPPSLPRYRSAAVIAARTWRLAPVVVAVVATCLLVLTAIVATGSPDPTVWTQRAATTLESIGREPSPAPGAQPGTAPSPNGKSPKPSTLPSPTREAGTSPRPRPSETPAHSASPEPRDSDDNPGPSPSPAPSPHDE